MKRETDSVHDLTTLPLEYLHQLLAGEHPLRVWRRFRDLTVETLAAQVGVAASDIAQMENDERDIPDPLRRGLATVLDIDPRALVRLICPPNSAGSQDRLGRKRGAGSTEQRQGTGTTAGDLT
jgi:transcriptional regulator with XRE-family HTH domain